MLVETMILLIVILLVAVIFYKYVYKPLQFWSEFSIPYTTGWPLFGSLWKFAFGLQALGHALQDSYNKHSKHRYFGFYLFNTPTLCIRDPDLVQQICIKDFDSFRDHRLFLPKRADPFWNKVLFSRRGQDWKYIRNVILPVFSNNKMTHFFTIMSECAQRLTNNFSETTTTELEMSNYFRKLTNDIAINSVFGIDCDSYMDPNNPFFQNAKEDFVITRTKSFKFFGAAISPFIAIMFKVTFFSEKLTNFFRKVIDDNFEQRRKQNIIRHDLLHFLKRAQTDKKVTDDDILAQIIGYVFTSYDTVTVLMSNSVYELAVNPEVQQRLIEEVDETWKACNNSLTYESLCNMKYMNMVTSEILRLRSPTINMDRVVTKPYTIHPVLPHEKHLHLEPGVDITIPVYCYLHDHRYFPNPEKFDPERFSEENKTSIPREILLSFGIGPRSCLGDRVTIIELKIVLFYILLKFRIVPVKKTMPFVMSKVNVVQCSENQYWLGLQPRNLSNT